MSDLDRYLDAFDFALASHGLARRKSGVRLAMTHPIAVVEILRRAGVHDTEILCAALLHDVIEDSAVKYDGLVERFGAAIADLVVECSDDNRLPREKRRAAQLAHAPRMSAGAKWIKLADLAANLGELALHRPLGWDETRTAAFRAHSARLLERLAGAHAALEGMVAEALALNPTSRAVR